MYRHIVGVTGQEWTVEGVTRDECIETYPRELKFKIYSTVLLYMRIRSPLTGFHQEVLQYMSVAPSEIHLKSWVFLRAFKLLMREMERPYSRNLSFTIFEVSWRGEKASNKNRREHLSLRGHSSYKFFKPFSDSLKHWKHNYLWVVPIFSKVTKMVAILNEVTSFKFPLAWTKSHYNRRPNTYSVKEERLDEEDKETLRLLRNLVTHLPSEPKVIKVHPLVKARSTKDDRRNKSPKVNLEKQTAVDYDHYIKDPLDAAAQVFKATSNLFKKWKREEGERMAGNFLEARNLWLEGDLQDKTDKLKSCYAHITALRKERGEANRKLEEAKKSLKPTTEALAKA